MTVVLSLVLAVSYFFNRFTKVVAFSIILVLLFLVIHSKLPVYSVILAIHSKLFALATGC